MRGLVVEVDDEWIEILRRALESLGVKVSAVSRFEDGLREIPSGSYDLVTLDLSLDPGRRFAWGKNLLAALKATKCVVPPMVIVSGTYEAEDLRDCINDYHDFIYHFAPKQPWHHQAFTHAVVDILEKRRSSGAPRAGMTDGAPEGGPRPDLANVMVVHGRNDQIRREIYSFLRSIGLKPIEWIQAVRATRSGAPYIGEVLDAAFGLAQAIVVLLTPDDEARIREHLRKDSDPSWERELTPQARPNVLFEAGMALGIAPARTILVQLGEVRPFSDISGRHGVRLDNSVEKRQALAQRLLEAGCLVDLTGNDWMSEGDFGE